LPTEHWLTPNGLQLAGKGLPPDVLVEATNSPDHWLLTHDVDIHERMMYDEVFQTGLQELRRLGGPETKAELSHPTKGRRAKRGAMDIPPHRRGGLMIGMSMVTLVALPLPIFS
jgi:hypothetical protein